MIVSGSISEVLLSGFTVITTTPMGRLTNFHPWRQFVNFQIKLTNNFQEGTESTPTALTDDDGTTIYRFVDRLNHQIENAELSPYTRNACCPCQTRILNCCLDRAHKIVRVLSPICPAVLEVPEATK